MHGSQGEICRSLKFVSFVLQNDTKCYSVELAALPSLSWGPVTTSSKVRMNLESIMGSGRFHFQRRVGGGSEL